MRRTLFFSMNPYPQTRLQLRWRWMVPLLITILGLMLAGTTYAQEPGLAEQLQALAHVAQEGIEAAEENNVTLMQTEYNELHTLWASFEDQIREQDPIAYVELEGALDTVKEALQAEPLDPVAVRLAYDHLLDEVNEVVEQSGDKTAVPSDAAKMTPADLLSYLETAHLAIEQGEVAEAEEQLTRVIQAWPSVEGAIAASSQDTYTAIEIDLSRAAAAFEAQPIDLQEATAAVERLQQSLAPFVIRRTYTMFDAAAIILREGLEALLVVAALLTFLRRSGNSDKRSWIWGGSVLGILASVATAFVLQIVFSHASAGQNRELIEGATSIIAAGLLFYVSYWLHSKASLHVWQNYINTRTRQALMRGNLVGLALLSFLAVFREGAETVVFYLGMASAITTEDLLLGLGLGIALLVVIALVVLVLGLKLPLRPFFRLAGILVYYLGFKFLGTGIHALQIAGILPASLIALVPTIPFVGLYPTWETIGPQIVLLIVALGAFLYLRAQDRRAQATASSTTMA
jgi:high-affinity iron transporter